MRNRTGIQAAHPGPARSARPRPRTASTTSATTTTGTPKMTSETSLDAYVARLVDAAPPLSSQQRDTLALLLRRPRRR